MNTEVDNKILRAADWQLFDIIFEEKIISIVLYELKTLTSIVVLTSGKYEHANCMFLIHNEGRFEKSAVSTLLFHDRHGIKHVFVVKHVICN